MKILFVAMPFSIHTARWISQLHGEGFDMHLFSSMPNVSVHKDIRGITYHSNFYQPSKIGQGNKHVSIQLKPLSGFRHPLLQKIIRKTMTVTRLEKPDPVKLARVIEDIRPDIIHSMETQHAGYLVKETKKICKTKFPFWMHSNWGIDLHFFGRLAAHQDKIRETLSGVDLFIVEGKRDEALSRQHGYKGPVRTFASAGGGFILPELPAVPPSQRKKILVKGTQDMVRRSLVALRALERCQDLLAGYQIVVYGASETTRVATELFRYNTGLDIQVIADMDYKKWIELNAEARLNICVNVSDGLPNAMLEAMMMGAFPVQSFTSVADEWIEHNKTGMLVPPEDPDVIEVSLRKALTDDELVDNAVELNRETIRTRLDYHEVKKEVADMYKTIFQSLSRN